MNATRFLSLVKNPILFKIVPGKLDPSVAWFYIALWLPTKTFILELVYSMKRTGERKIWALPMILLTEIVGINAKLHDL